MMGLRGESMNPMTFGNMIHPTLGGGLYEVWEVYGDLMGVIGVVFMRFGKCMGTLGVIGPGVVYMRFGNCMWPVILFMRHARKVSKSLMMMIHNLQLTIHAQVNKKFNHSEEKVVALKM